MEMGILVSIVYLILFILSDTNRVVVFVVGFCGILLFLFVPETFWDRTPIPKSRRSTKNHSRPSLFDLRKRSSYAPHNAAIADKVDGSVEEKPQNGSLPVRPAPAHHSASAVSRSLHVGFVPNNDETVPNESNNDHSDGSLEHPSTSLSSTAISPLDTNSTGMSHYLVQEISMPTIVFSERAATQQTYEFVTRRQRSNYGEIGYSSDTNPTHFEFCVL
jgi:hypothetical protein